MALLGIILLVAGVIAVVLAYALPAPPPVAALGWACLVIGLLLILLAYLLPVVQTEPAYHGMQLLAAQGTTL